MTLEEESLIELFLFRLIYKKKKTFMNNNHANKPQNHHKNFAIASAHGDHHGVYPPYFDVS